MTVMHNDILQALTKSIVSAIQNSFGASPLAHETIYRSFTEPPNADMGHFAFPCFALASAFKTSPMNIAAKIAENIPNQDAIGSVVAMGPYVNFKVSCHFLGKNIVQNVVDGYFFEKKIITNPEKTMVEFSAVNTHKTLHVGHMRNLCLGQAIVKILRYVGHNVSAVTYPGDVGTHVAKCLWYLKYHFKDSYPEQDRGDWLGEIYTIAHNKLEDEKGTEFEAKNRAQLTEILKQIHDESGEFYELWMETRQWSIALMEKAYQWADVTFDRWFWESEMDAPSLNTIKDLHKQGLLIEDQGAVGMDLSDEKLGFCMLIKSDGTGLYATKDIELAKVKFQEFGIDRNIYVVDFRQAHHFKQVFKVLEKIGFPQAEKCFHLQYAMVELPDGAMSSRKGNIIPLSHLLKSMEEQIKQQYLNKYLTGEKPWTISEVNKTASIIADGAIKYGMLKIDNGRIIVFDMNEWLKLDGDTGPYLQYVYARISSLIEKVNAAEHSESPDWSKLSTEMEMNLMVKLSLFNDIVLQSAEQMKPSLLCGYLYDLGKFFNVFYNQCPIGKAENLELQFARLRLAKATGLVMAKGLEILGIKAPSRM